MELANIRVRGIEQNLFDRLNQRAIESIFNESDNKFGIVELQAEWDFDKVQSFKGPVVIRQCRNFLIYSELLNLQKATEIFEVNFQFWLLNV